MPVFMVNVSVLYTLLRLRKRRPTGSRVSCLFWLVARLATLPPMVPDSYVFRFAVDLSSFVGLTESLGVAHLE